MPTYRLLAGDIGGTNARLVLYSADDTSSDLSSPTSIASHSVVAQHYYKTHDFASFTEILCAFTALSAVARAPIDAACLATAGPVSGNRINFTNREGWIIDGDAIGREFGIRDVRVINDFQAAGFGVLGLEEGEVICLQEGGGGRGGGGVKACVGAGTGLGECFLTADRGGVYNVFASEGGHVEFAPRDGVEEELLRWLQGRLGEGERGRVSVERVVSGKGLENIYEFLRERAPAEVDAALDKAYGESGERGRLIGAEKYNYPLFMQALEIMMAIYGGEVGNAALKYLPFEGIYIAGGIAPKNIEFIRGAGSKFMERLVGKGRMTSIMSSIPVYVVMQEDLGLRGAHVVAARIVSEGKAAQRSVGKGSGEVGALTSAHRTLSIRSAMQSAVTDYPLACAAFMSITAGMTATAVAVALVSSNIVTRSLHSRNS